MQRKSTFHASQSLRNIQTTGKSELSTEVGLLEELVVVDEEEDDDSTKKGANLGEGPAPEQRPLAHHAQDGSDAHLCQGQREHHRNPRRYLLTHKHHFNPLALRMPSSALY